MALIAVVDLETTGLNPYRFDRVLEVAAMAVDTDSWRPVRELVTLVNPDRDIGPTSIHGLTASDVASAPRFREIAGNLLEVLNGCVALAGHNVRFDHSFLECEFRRLGMELPPTPTVCTMRLAGGGSLAELCSDYRIELAGDAHMAHADMHATAALLKHLLDDAPVTRAEILSLPAIAWPMGLARSECLRTRESARAANSSPPTFLRRLVSRIPLGVSHEDEPAALLEYTALLNRVLEDRHIDELEADALVELAENWNLSGQDIRARHVAYFSDLAVQALSDGVLTNAEQRDLSCVARLLGISAETADGLLDTAKAKLADSECGVDRTENTASGLIGRRVCFTGESACSFRGVRMTRDMARHLATERGILVAESVTKALDVLVVADPLTLSGKARKARQYGTRIVHEVVFWRELGIEVA